MQQSTAHLPPENVVPIGHEFGKTRKILVSANDSFYMRCAKKNEVCFFCRAAPYVVEPFPNHSFSVTNLS